MRSIEPRKLLLWAAAGAAGLALAVVLHFWQPPEDLQASVCVFRRATGIPCPGCGLTRAFAHLAKGEGSEAFADHPLAPVVAVELGLGWLAWGLALWDRLPARARLAAGLPSFLLVQVAVLILLWFGRLATGTLP